MTIIYIYTIAQSTMKHTEIDSKSIPIGAYFCARKAPSARKEPEVECISSSCSSTSESDDVPNPLSAAERAKLKVGLCCELGDPNSQGFV